MRIDQLIVVKETREQEGRVALTPSTVSTVVAKGYAVMVENDAGKLAGFTNDDYRQAGATIFNLDAAHLPAHSLILRVKCPTQTRREIENIQLSSNTVMLGFLDPFDLNHENHLMEWQALGITILDLELLNLSANDPKNALAAMSRFAGRLAFQDAFQRYHGAMPKRVTVLGTGAAGLAAAFAARKAQLPVQLFGRQEQYRAAVEAIGVVYRILPASDQSAFIRAHLNHETIIISAVRIAGKQPPLLIDEASLAVLPDNAVIVDLSAGEGGSVWGSKEDTVVQAERNISITNVSGYPKSEPAAASEDYAQCIVHLLAEIMSAEGEINFENPLLHQLIRK